jgi:NOL1/NOP2/fmu family ribosome biogenesis protein
LGEGHYICLIKKPFKSSYINNIKDLKDNFKSIHQLLNIKEGYIYKVNDTFYYLNKYIDTKGLHIIRGGLKLGVEEKYGFVYDHAISRVFPINPVELTLEEAKSYLEGNQIIKNSKDGFVTLTYQNNGIGLGKSSKNKINNKYPKGLRIKI